VQVGDVAIALPSSGIHSNGYSLVRKIMAASPRGTQPNGGFAWSDCPDELEGASLGEVLLTPTRIYVQPILQARRAGLPIHGMAHITGGGLPENLPRCLGDHQSIQLDLSDWTMPPIFQWLAQAGEVSLPDMFNTFNMGIGFVLLVSPDAVETVVNWFQRQNLPPQVIGTVVSGEGDLLGLPQ
jgi:phosphoribosylformylglycinamidine cyclo-ligase